MFVATKMVFSELLLTGIPGIKHKRPSGLVIATQVLVWNLKEIFPFKWNLECF